MCFPKKPKKMNAPATLAQPEAVAQEDEIGGARKREDEELFGEGVPQLRQDRAAVTPGLASGSGLRMT